MGLTDGIVDEAKLAAELGQQIRGILTAYGIDQLRDKGVEIEGPAKFTAGGYEIGFEGKLTVRVAK